MPTTPTRQELAEALRGWGGKPPKGWSYDIHLAQKRAGLRADGLWGPACRRAGIDAPKETD